MKTNDIFTTKANVLQFLQNKVSKSKIEQILDFTIMDWEKNEQDLLKSISYYFGKRKLIIRSSAIGEDSITESNAGNYESVLQVDSYSKKQLKKAIKTVIRSYILKGNNNKKNQILIQPFTHNTKLSGVVFTTSPEKNSPYYVINFDESASTIGVTQGLTNNTIKIFKQTPESEIPKKWISLIKAVKEIENILSLQQLDIEFGITGNNQIIIFQVRPITFIKKIIPFLDKKITKLIQANNRKFLKLNKLAHVPGKYTIFSDMSDWNPAEIIGNNPKRLDYSLYDFLIMKDSWHIGRTSLGYQNVSPSPLMTKFGNKPYVDIRASFNSLIPNKIPLKLKKKLMKYYLQKLEENPFLHDKVEFEILLTCYDFGLDSKFKELRKKGFSPNEIDIIKNCLLDFTNNIISKFPDILNQCLISIQKLTKIRNQIKQDLSSNNDDFNSLIISAKNLLHSCKKYGTIQFSMMARISFMSSILLKSLIKEDYVNSDFADQFMNSIETLLSEFRFDVTKYRDKKISKKQFLQKYGHLRPGTYDITAPRYDKESKFFKNVQFLNYSKSDKKISLPINIQKILEEHGLDFSNIDFETFLRKSIIYREQLKFEFTKNLSDAMELIALAGKMLGFSREEISYLDINFMLKPLSKPKSALINEWKQKIYRNKNTFILSESLILPPIISHPKNFEIIQYFISEPNYITNRKITGDLVNLNQKNPKSYDFTKKIILVENADPGFDWIFTHNPSGLITKYGGVASHMAIRCAEIGLPAAIGCGELLYEKLIHSTKVLLDCKNKQLTILENIYEDEYVEEKKVLKSLGYIK